MRTVCGRRTFSQAESSKAMAEESADAAPAADFMSPTSPRPSPPFINGGEGEKPSGDGFETRPRLRLVDAVSGYAGTDSTRLNFQPSFSDNSRRPAAGVADPPRANGTRTAARRMPDMKCLIKRIMAVVQSCGPFVESRRLMVSAKGVPSFKGLRSVAKWVPKKPSPPPV